MMEFVTYSVTWIAMIAIVLSTCASLMEVPKPTGMRLLMIKLALIFATIAIVTRIWQLCCMGEG